MKYGRATTLTGEKAVPVLYLDLVSTIIHGPDELGHFPNGPEDVVVYPEALTMMRRWRDGGGRIIVVSNQGGIALGYVSQVSIALMMTTVWEKCDRLPSKMAWCLHHPNAEHPELARCWCRKPSPGLLVEAALRVAERHRGEIYPPHLGLMVGDRDEDQECARLAGLDFQWAHEWRSEARQ